MSQINRETQNQIDAPKMSNNQKYSTCGDSLQENHQTNVLTRKYFGKWKKAVKSHDEKLDNFLKTLDQRKATRKCIKPQENCYENRFKAQKNIIEMQKQKLLIQDKFIEDLKLGILNRDLETTIEETKAKLRDMFIRSSTRTKCSIKPIGVNIAEETFLDFQVKSSRVPKTVLKMEQRAIERAERRLLIVERKKLAEEQYRMQVEAEIERKKTLDEHERIRQLEAIKENRRMDLLKQKRREYLRHKYEALTKRAEEYYRRKLIHKSFAKLLKNYVNIRQAFEASLVFYENNVQRKSLRKLSINAQQMNEVKNYEADRLYWYKIKKKYIAVWKTVHCQYVKKCQVAEDFYELYLCANIFKNWHKHVCSRYVQREKLSQKVHLRYCRKLIFHYFYQWKSLPVVNRLEKAKEEKKRKWRDKVCGILLDYEPPRLD